MSLHSFYSKIRLLNKHKLVGTEELSQPDSIIIPFYGSDYIAEALLSANFACQNVSNLKEIVLIGDQCPSLINLKNTNQIIRYHQLDIKIESPINHNYRKIYDSRIYKIYASKFATHDKILVIDSDLMLLQSPHLFWSNNGVTGSFRKGSMIAKFYQSGEKKLPLPLRKTYRPYIKEHLNGAFMAAKKQVWSILREKWLNYYCDIWTTLPDNQPPTDQLPLTCALDHLKLKTFNAGNYVNWPVSKNIGGRTAKIPKEVIGAHGGFPLSEWERYQLDKDSFLNFKDDGYTRTSRYLKDCDRNK